MTNFAVTKLFEKKSAMFPPGATLEAFDGNLPQDCKQHTR